MEMLNLGAVLKKNLELTVLLTLNGNNKYMHYLPFGIKIVRETDIADNLVLPNHHLIEKTH